ncbi:MAG: hypothetical protein ACI9XO_001418 [Paraglaciecola sp.]|jgi:hypothetical protein
MNPTIKKIVPHLAAFFILMAVSFIWFKPYVFDGKVLQQSDNVQALGMQAEMRKVSKETGKLPLWTNSQFAGMPAYQILYSTKNQLKHVFKAALLGNYMSPPHTAILLLMIGFYFLMIVLGVDWRIGILGAIPFGLSVYYMDLVVAGHSTKLIAIGYLAPILAAMLLVFRKKYLAGGGLFALFFGLQMYANHLQITYYLFLCLGVFGIFKLVEAVKNNTLPEFGKAAGILIFASLLAVGTNFGRLWTTYEYSQETIRGTSELTKANVSSSGSGQGGDGLSKDYAFDWSYGKMETFNLLIPNFVGGTSAKSFASDRSSASFKTLMKVAKSNEEAQQLSAALGHYWGPQRFTGSPVYMGAVLIFLFFLGGFLVKGLLKNWLIVSTLLMIMIAWGSNFSTINYLLFDYFPMFNKFRAVSMAMGVAFFFLIALAMIGLQEFLKKKVSNADKQKALYLAGGVTGGLILIGLLLSFGFNYGMSEEKNAALPQILKDAIASDRAGLLQADALRSLGFTLAVFGFMWAYLKKGFAPLLLAVGVGIIAIMDMVGVSSRFLTAEDYIKQQQKTAMTQPSEADKQIMSDKDLHYRVADWGSYPFTSALASYHHKSMGGYHAAKLMRFQEMVETYLNDPGTSSKLYGMLNTKYFIGQGRVSRNPDVLGNAWFVPNFEVVPTVDDEFEALKNLDPKQKAVIAEQYAAGIKGQNFEYDSTGSIRLTAYNPDEMVYQYSAKTPQLTMFSEVYYPPSKGWKMYLDGEPMEDFTKANFILRAAVLPAGQHEVKMVFEPTSYYTGETISLISSILVLLFAFGGLGMYLKNNGMPEVVHLPEGEKRVEKNEVKRTVSKKKKK